MNFFWDKNYYSGWFSTESVSEGHPDKLADQIAEAVLDYVVKKDSNAHVACEVIVMNQKILIGGEIKANKMALNRNFKDELISLANKVIKKDIGYSEQSWDNLQKLKIEVNIQAQSTEIDQKVSLGKSEIGSGDNSTVYGWAENSNVSEYYPFSQSLANLILKKINQLRKTNNNFNFGPDGKIQILLKDQKLKAILLCQQFITDISTQKVKEQIHKEILNPLVEKLFIKDVNFDFFLTPFFKGGPIADTGLTGRKIAVDNYGTCVRNGGGSFAGKDVTKSDRTLALFARFIAKNIVKLNLTSEIEIQITSRIGQTKNFFIGYSTKKGEKIKINKIIRYFSSWTFKDIIEKLNLRKVSFQKYASYGYFARAEEDAYWEKPFLIPALKKII